MISNDVYQNCKRLVLPKKVFFLFLLHFKEQNEVMR